MRVLLAALILSLTAVSGLAEIFNLREQGRLELFPVGEWNVRGEDQGDLRIQLTPKSPKANAACEINVTTGGPDEFSTKTKLSRQVTEAARRMLESGDFVENTATIKSFYCKQGFGFYFTLTDPKLVGREPVPGDYKQVTMGMIRLSAGVIIEVQILSDGEKTGEFQQLLGIIEGMELQGK